ncbi:MAG: HRDC domain-containing protein, partial [Coriobacteriia bacterium]|nr:HRDC domain-containing protein [Coriobacteriia bacterium]
VGQELQDAGIRAGRYHAGLSMQERNAAQADFVNDELEVLVATNAFGMGIDKSNVRFVIHNNMPGSLEAYYQEAGRAGRDGEPAECVLLWNDGDIGTCRFFIEQEVENDRLDPEDVELVRMGKRRLLGAMIGYCLTTDCLRTHILRYFGEQGDLSSCADRLSADAGCGNCSNCSGDFESVDVTQTARAIMRCVQELRGRFGKGVVVDVLRGAKNENVRRYELDKCSTYGSSDEAISVLKEVIELLACREHLLITEGKFPLVGFGPKFREVADPRFSLGMKKHLVARPDRTPRFGGMGSGASLDGAGQVRGIAGLDEMDAELFERLRALRKRLADEAGVPPYMVFSDATLRGLAQRRPKSKEQMLDVSGVGQKKLERYGAEFLAEIAS